MARKPKPTPSALTPPRPKFSRGDKIETLWGSVGTVELIRYPETVYFGAFCYSVRATEDRSHWRAGVLYEIAGESIARGLKP